MAPADRVGIGEEFGLPANEETTGKMVAALRKLGFDKVYDTVYSADLTIMEEGTELLQRITNNGVLPQFTSCCPGWIKFIEQYYPELLPNLSSCKSPQQMMGAIMREVLPEKLGVKNEDIFVCSVMPCTAKKFEIRRPEFEYTEGKSKYHFIEVMTCPGGCVNGGGQPIDFNAYEKIERRTAGLYKADKDLPRRKSQDNPAIIETYEKVLPEGPCGHKAHHLLHTTYAKRGNFR